MRALMFFSAGQSKLLVLWAFLLSFCALSWFDSCAAFVPTKDFSPKTWPRAAELDWRDDSIHFSSSLALANTPRGGASPTAGLDESKSESETTCDLEVVKFLTSTAIFHCGKEEGLSALSVLNELCERRLPFDFDSFLSQQEKDSVEDSDKVSDKGERVISLLRKFLPEKTTNEFLESVRIMEEEGWMSTNPDSVDGLPSLHLNLVSNGKPLFSSPVDEEGNDGAEVSFENQIHKLYELVRPFVYETLLPEANQLLRSQNDSGTSGRKLRVSDVFLRRYGEDICGSVTRNGISIHYDVYSRITAVVALDEVASRGDNGLFTLEVDEDTGETSNHKALRRFFPLQTGDCVLHTWDVLHGVDVEAGLDRTSLIVWFDEEEGTKAEGTDENEMVSQWLSLEDQGLDSTRTTLNDGNDVRQFVLASALASTSSSDIEEAAINLLYLTSAAKGNSFALTRMGSICEEGSIGDLKEDAFDVLDKLRTFDELPVVLREMLIRLRETATDKDAAERTELACRFWLEGSLTGNPLAQKSLADEVMLEASQSGNPEERLLAATLFALASQQDAEEGPSDSLARVIEYDVAAREVQSQEEFLASPVVQTASAALGGLGGIFMPARDKVRPAIMNRDQSKNPFDDDYDEGENTAANNSGSNYNTFVLGDEHPQKYIKSRQVPLSFSSNPFQDEEPRHLPSTTPPVSPWGSHHSPLNSPQQNRGSFMGGDVGTITSSEMSPLLPDDLSRSHQSNASSRGTASSSSRRRISVPKRIFTASPPRPRRAGNRRRRGSAFSSGNQSCFQKPDILLTELASGGDDPHSEESIHMEYKYILLEDLGTAVSWTILILPYATFSFSVFLLYLGSTQVAAMGLTVTALRLSCCSVMLCFIVYWIRKMEMVRLTFNWCNSLGKGLWRMLRNCLISEEEDDEEEKDPDETYWWKNPWVLFPERYYILPLLLSSLLVLEPIPVAIYFFPSIGTPTLYAIAEASSGAGIQACSLIYLCLVQGFRYHTGTRSKRRAELQRKALQLRKAAKFLSDGKENHKEFTSSPRIVNNYYDEVGDIDGSTFTAHLRLPNDPCADGWADFLLPKIFLSLIGTLSTTLAAFTRPSAHNPFPNETLFTAGSIVYGMTLSIWTYLTLVALYETGEKLKREPFLGTRPAQLAYRILCAHSGLAILGLGIASMEYYGQFQGSLRLGSIASIVEEGSRVHPGDVSFPGLFGRLVCLTVQVAITAFIFLPPHTMDYEEHGDDEKQELTELQILSKNRRDKRLVIHLAKESRTWRVFPCPIQNLDDGISNPFQDNMFQIYKDFHTDKNTHDRGLVSIGPYIPVFCAELACWLNEASWQAYNSPVGSPETEKQINVNEKIEESDDFCGWMRLDVIGLQLEGYVYDERTSTQAYIATNSASQVDGEEDSVIVVAFRGTSDATNVKTDFRVRQVPLHDQITGIGESAFKVFPDRFEVSDSDGWLWDTNGGNGSDDNKEFVKCVGCWSDDAPPCTPTHKPAGPPQEGRQRLYSVGGMEGVVSKETADILKVAPLARNSFPMVHEGFQDAYSEIRKQLFDLLLPVLQRQLAKSTRSSRRSGKTTTTAKEPLALPKIYCTGHSLGGSLAQIFALDLASNCEIVLPVEGPPPSTSPKSPFFIPSVDPQSRFFPLSPPLPKRMQQGRHELHLQPPIGVYTYGQPRVGNRAFSRLYKQKVPHSFRVVNEGDAFTTIPNYFWCGGHYKHAGLEVILDGGMTGNVLVGPTVVETLFRFHKVRTNVLAHQIQRYRECLECIFDDSQLMEYYKDHNIAYEELLGDRRTRDDDEEKQKNIMDRSKFHDANNHWMDGELTAKDGLEWYN